MYINISNKSFQLMQLTIDYTYMIFIPPMFYNFSTSEPKLHWPFCSCADCFPINPIINDDSADLICYIERKPYTNRFGG